MYFFKYVFFRKIICIGKFFCNAEGKQFFRRRKVFSIHLLEVRFFIPAQRSDRIDIIIGKKKAAEAGNSSTGLATAGLVLGVIGTAFSAVGVICALACVGAASAATETAGLDLLSSAKEAVTEAVTSAANEISSTVSDAANSIASSAADEVNSMASSAADKAAEAASSAAKDFVNSLFS